MPAELVLQSPSELSNPSRRLESASAFHPVIPASDEACRVDEPSRAHAAPTPRRHGAYERWLLGRDSQRGGGDGQSVEWFFDNLDHDLLMKAVRTHIKDRWVLLYLERWLRAPFEAVDGDVVFREKGTPQGGVVSPMLMNLFMHYAFDRWMQKTRPQCPFARYADDAVVHCRSQAEAERLLTAIGERLAQCKLTMHPEKSKVVYCKNSNRRQEYPQVQFTFLGFTFKPRASRNKQGTIFTGFLPAASRDAIIRMLRVVKSWQLQRQTPATIEELSARYNPVLRGWWNYYGSFYPSVMDRISFQVDRKLARWARRKHKRLAGHVQQSAQWLARVARHRPRLFIHWQPLSSRVPITGAV